MTAAGLPPNALSVNASTTVKGRDMVETKVEFAESSRPEKNGSYAIAG